MCLKDTVARSGVWAHEALQNITTSTNDLRCPAYCTSMGEKTSAGTQQTTAQGSEADPGSEHKVQPTGR